MSANDSIILVMLVRAQATSSVIGYFAYEQDLPELLEAASPPAERLYMLGLANFENKEVEGLERFNNAAIEPGLFNKHGMHIEYQLTPFKAVAVVGGSNVLMPDRIQLFFLDSAENFKTYLVDPRYKEFSPLRDKTFTKNDFFAGTLK